MKHVGGMLDWDGAPLGDETLVELEIEWEEPAAKGAGTPLDEAIRRASQGDSGRCGIVIEGAPGSGKSVLSHRLATRLRQPPFDELGLAVRRGARELAIALESSPEAPLGNCPIVAVW